MTPDEIASSLAAFIARAAAAADVGVENMRRLTGGASRETWSCDATVDGRAIPLILQRDVRGAAKGMSRATEFALLRAVFDAGVPSPEPLWMGDGSLGGEFFLVRRIDGAETLPRRLLRDDAYAPARRALPKQLGAILARIHAVPYGAPALAELPTTPADVSVAVTSLQRHEEIFRAVAPEPHPAFELAFRWLATRARDMPAAGARTLVHGDYRMGNVLFDAEGARAVLDWELAHVGDPAEDLAWMCVRSWRFGGVQPVGGIGTREEFFAAYEEAGGGRVDPDVVRFWEVFGNLRWGIICITQARTYLDGHSNSVELASIGRRTAETEWELLSLID